MTQEDEDWQVDRDAKMTQREDTRGWRIEGDVDGWQEGPEGQGHHHFQVQMMNFTT